MCELIEPEGRLVEELIYREDGKIQLTVETDWDVFELVLSPDTRTLARLESLSVGDAITIVVHRDVYEEHAFDVLV